MMKTRIAFWGTPPLTTIYLEALNAAGMTPVVVVTNPDRPKGRGQALAAPEAKVWALEHNIPVLQPEKINDDFFTELSKYDLDLSIVVAYGSILPQRFIDLPKHKTLNVHYSLLPRFRGAAPVESAILAGDSMTGSAIQMMARALDSGLIIAEQPVEIAHDETAPALRARLSDIGAKLLVETLPAYLAGSITPRLQDESLVTHSGKIQKGDGLLDLADDAKMNYQKYRAYYEWPRTYFFVEQNGKKLRVIITEAHMENSAFTIDRVLPEGKKEMAYEDFKRGYLK